MTRVDDDSDYDWGAAIANLKDIRPGDILQFRDHLVAETVTTAARFRAAHGLRRRKRRRCPGATTAIVEHMADADGAIGTLAKCEAARQGGAEKDALHARLERVQVRKQTWRRPTSKRPEVVSVTTTRSLVVTGRVWAYRPRPK